MGSSAKDIILELQKLNCCNICILRFLNERCVNTYNNSKHSISKLLGVSYEIDETVAKQRKMNPCTSCLGLLQDSEMEKQIYMIVKEVSYESYDADQFSIALSLPTALLIRNHSLWLYISDIFKNFYLNKHIYSDMDGTYGNLKAEVHTSSIKETWKLIASPLLAEQLKKTINTRTDSPFIVNVNFEYKDNEKETACMVDMHPDIFGGRENQKRKYRNEIFTRKSVENALENTERELLEKFATVPPSNPTHYISCTSVTCTHDSLYLAGRYNKYSRCLSQTPWLINGERRMESSVEEIISRPVSRYIPHDGIKFASSGREDVDVRTLGRGRPFVLDVQNPRKVKLTFEELRTLENEINKSSDSVFVRDLQVAPKKDLVHIKMGETSKTKTYHCYCVIKAPEDERERNIFCEILKSKLKDLNSLEPFVIDQRTPVRVLHRRPLATRPRTVYWIKSSFSHAENENIFFKLQLKVEAGTYIKELVHGDLGRTNPNISIKLGVDADILALDVEEVDLPWPPAVCSTSPNDGN